MWGISNKNNEPKQPKKKKFYVKIGLFIPDYKDSFYCIKYSYNGITWETLTRYDEDWKKRRANLFTWDGLNAYWRRFAEQLTPERLKEYENEQLEIEREHKAYLSERAKPIYESVKEY